MTMPSTSISNRRVDARGETRAQHEAPEGAFLGVTMVIILDGHKKPAGFTTEGHIRRLTEKHKAVIYRKFPCVAILTKADVRDFADVRSYRIKIDPGAKHTGIAVVCNETDEAVFFMQVEHRGEQVKKNVDKRRSSRRNRKNRETGYRRCKYKGGRGGFGSSRKEDWLPPSVKSTADNIVSWVRRLSRWINLTECSFEAVRFDTQLMDNPDIEGVEYQQGELFGYEVKEYLLDRYGHTCQYCGGSSGDRILEWEHIVPKSRGGSDSVKNATLSCRTCNMEKNDRRPDEWAAAIKAKPILTELDKARLEGIGNVLEGGAKVSNRYCAWTNSMRRYTERFLFGTFSDVECSSGGRTKYNRTSFGLPKDHHYDALCVGDVPEDGYTDRTGGYVLMVKATGRGSRLRGNVNACGIITVKYKNRAKTYNGFMTGDIVKADVPKEKHKGRWTGRITIRSSGSFGLVDGNGERHDINCKYMTVIQKADGYAYHYERRPA